MEGTVFKWVCLEFFILIIGIKCLINVYYYMEIKFVRDCKVFKII